MKPYQFSIREWFIVVWLIWLTIVTTVNTRQLAEKRLHGQAIRELGLRGSHTGIAVDNLDLRVRDLEKYSFHVEQVVRLLKSRDNDQP